jgi:branched-chain amino acid transport system ATP-binding protein
MLNLLTGVDRPDAGVVTFQGTNITGRSAEAISRLGIARTFQRSRFFPQLTVLENVMVGAYAYNRRWGRLAHFLNVGPIKREDKELRTRAINLLELVGLQNRAHDVPGSLALAQQKLLDVCRVVMARPKLILLAEPGAGLHHSESVALGEMLAAIRAAGTAVVIIDHNLSLIMGIADEVVMLDVGRIIAQGTPQEVERSPQVAAAYLGSSAGNGETEVSHA